MLKIYDYFRSSACYRVRIALNLKKIDFEALPVHLVNDGGEQLKPQYQALNPQALVPALEENGRILTQSLAIIEYLDEVHPTPALLPSDPFAKARVRAFAYAIAADLHPLNNLRVLKYLTHDMGISEEQKNTWYQHWMAKGLSALEKLVTGSAQQTAFCFGESPSLADICLIPQMYNARRFHCDTTAYPTLRRIDEHCQTLPAFSHARPLETAN
jgi:maleylacetoacetate isomerase